MPPVSIAPKVLPEAIRRRFATVVAAGLQALRSRAQKAEVQETPGKGWTLSCTVPASQMQSFEATTEFVGDALLKAAEASDGVYIVGYEAMPFAALGSRPGFSATLALVPDEANACWDLLARGYCRRGCACRWQHPSWQVTVEVGADCLWAQ
jgi:hypothetical protein